MTEPHNNPAFWKHLLSVAGLGVAILIGFVLGLRFGERGRVKPEPPVAPVFGGLIDSLPPVDTVAVADTVSVAPEKPESPKKPGPSKTEIAQGVEYLATHNRWNRDEMEQIPALQGLWDAVNVYALDEILAYNETLGSTPLTTIVEGLEKKPKQGFYADKYDHVITLSTYVKRLR